MGVIDDVASIKKELEEVKEETKKEKIRIQELNKIKKANKKLLKCLLITIFAFMLLLLYTILMSWC